MTGALSIALVAAAQALASEAVSSGPVPATAPAPFSVALLALQPLGTGPDVVHSLEEFLRAEVRRLPQVRLLERAAVDAALATLPEEEQDCQGREACLVRQGRHLQVDKLLHGTVATLGEDYVIDLKLIDVARGVEVQRLSQLLSGDELIMIEGIRVVTVRLLAPERYVGTLAVQLDHPGAEVYVDGELRGWTPLPPISDLSPGKHGLKILLQGYRDFDRFVEIYFARTTTVNVSLRGTNIEASFVSDGAVAQAEALAPVPGAAPAPPLSVPLRTAGWIAVGAGGGLVSGGAAVLAVLTVETLGTLVPQSGYLVAQDAERYAELRRSSSLGWVAWGVAGAGLAVGLAGAGLVVADSAGLVEESTP